MRRCSFIFIWIWCLSAIAAEVIPPAPEHYFNDYAHVVDSATVGQLDAQLKSFEQSTGNQVVVAIYPKMQSDSSIDDYAVRVFRSWRVGQKDKNNGVVLFVFINDRKMFIEVGYGLEGALPDALCKQITEYEIKPRFKAGDYTGGLTAGVSAIIAATRGEFKGTGTTVDEQRHNGAAPNLALVITLLIFGGYIFLLIYSRSASGRRHGWIISSGGWGGYSGGGGGGWGGGGGGGFSGGGGSSGGEAPGQVGDMKASDFLNRLEHDAIVKEIGDVEAKMRGEIRVFISRKETKDAVVAAQKMFHHLGMEKAPERNGVLLFVAPRVRKFAVIGDSAVHERCGDKFWKEVAYEMSGYFGRGEFTEGIIHGVRRAGKLLADHFPRHPGDEKQRPGDIVQD